MTDIEMPPIPTWLLRGHPDCKIARQQTVAPASVTLTEQSKRRLTRVFKDKVAIAVIAQVRRGNNTFGKLRKSVVEFDDRELKAGIRHAMKWMPMVERKGTRAKPQINRYQARLELNGRTYSVVTM